ncbi:hypothetical protein [Alicyclobacillus fodiniaquatilis]|jgi:hypothetical protein|uniref:Uncharacterized protein n=1 Tax=Alicyclobacillus fodiniaquatilis TaxID=1661150 RepID=A0ABW4JHR1_9BACL
MPIERSLFAKYGGVHFTQQASSRDINEFVKTLGADKRDSLFEVLGELDKAGLIHIENDHDWVDPYGDVHPAHPHEQGDKGPK